MSNSTRLDVHLVQQGLAPSRTKAQELIEAGEVFVDRGSGYEVITSSSYKTDPQWPIRLQNAELLKYVSRSGLKLEGALRHLQLDVKGLSVLDAGLSTGGFSDCVLSLGASPVVGVDVGTEQVADKLKKLSKSHPQQFSYYENTDIRKLDQQSTVALASFDLVVCDLSFISLLSVISALRDYIKPGGHLLALVKPQFEVPDSDERERIFNKRGIIKDVGHYERVKVNISTGLQAHGYQVLDYFASEVKGRDGNQEFFVFAARACQNEDKA